jgi:hypothetical protein
MTVRAPVLVLAAVVVTLTSAATIAWPDASASAAGPRGDPGGRILAELSAVRHAVPSDASAVHVYPMEPVITSSCDTTQPGVVDRILFTSYRPLGQVQAAVSAVLRRAGWRHWRSFHLQGSGEYFGAQVLTNQSVVEWVRRLPQGLATAQLEVDVPVRGWHQGQPLQWLLAAGAMGVGEPKRHCGAA